MKKVRGEEEGAGTGSSGDKEKQELRMKMWSAARIPEAQTAPLQLSLS